MRTPNGEYPEYHSSADNLSLLRPECLDHSLAVLRRIVAVIEGNESTAAAIRKANRSSAGVGSTRRWAVSARRATTRWRYCGF